MLNLLRNCFIVIHRENLGSSVDKFCGSFDLDLGNSLLSLGASSLESGLGSGQSLLSQVRVDVFNINTLDRVAAAGRVLVDESESSTDKESLRLRTSVHCDHSGIQLSDNGNEVGGDFKNTFSTREHYGVDQSVVVEDFGRSGKRESHLGGLCGRGGFGISSVL